MTEAVYIHIPFCQTHCPYCDFAVWLDPKGKHFEAYTAALCEEIAKRAQGEQLETIYFGGGTPSILPLFLLKKLFERLHSSFAISQQTEITLEVNPGTVNEEKLLAFKSLGINRLSLGVQSFDQNLLRKLARLHSGEDAINLIQVAQHAGFDNLSLDLIYGLPKQTVDQWTNTLDQALELNIPHISCYSLTIEENTPFKKIYADSSHPELPTEDNLCAMYEILQQKAKAKGFIQYEVSNFAKAGFQSRHNLTYWRNQEFYGFGVSAHEFRQGKRLAHSRDLNAYINNPLEQTELDCDLALEEIMLRLRLREGIDLDDYKIRFGIDVWERKQDLLEDYLKQGLIELNGKQLNLTETGFLLSTHLIAQLT